MSEASEQELVCRYLDIRQILYFHPANGGKRNASEAAHFKRLGVKAGVPDLVICEPRGRYHGLYIEMKDIPSRCKTTEAQDKWLKALKDKGYYTSVCHGFSEAKNIIDKYMTSSWGGGDSDG